MSKSIDRLTLLQTFARIAERGSISAAARDLGMSQASASRQLKELEERVGIELIRRTTHALTLTPSGEACLSDARALLDGWDALLEQHSEAPDTLRGRLHVVAPVALGQIHLARAVVDFQQQHPELDLVWELQDEPIRFVECGCDIWIKVGAVPDDRLVVHPLTRVERLVVAAPSLLRSKATLRTISQLPCVAVSPFEGGTIPLVGSGGRPATLEARSVMTTNNIFAAREAALGGVGYAVMPRWFVDAEMAAGLLVDLLPGWRAPSLDVVAAYLPQARQPRRVRAFLDHLSTSINTIPRILAGTLGASARS